MALASVIGPRRKYARDKFEAFDGDGPQIEHIGAPSGTRTWPMKGPYGPHDSPTGAHIGPTWIA